MKNEPEIREEQVKHEQKKFRGLIREMSGISTPTERAIAAFQEADQFLREQGFSARFVSDDDAGNA